MKSFAKEGSLHAGHMFEIFYVSLRMLRFIEKANQDDTGDAEVRSGVHRR